MIEPFDSRIQKIMKMRKRQGMIVKAINKLNEEFDKIASDLRAIELNCSHLWSKRSFNAKQDLFKRTCQKCGLDDYRKN